MNRDESYGFLGCGNQSLPNTTAPVYVFFWFCADSLKNKQRQSKEKYICNNGHSSGARWRRDLWDKRASNDQLPSAGKVEEVLRDGNRK